MYPKKSIPTEHKTARYPRTQNIRNDQKQRNIQRNIDNWTIPRVKYEYEIVPWEVFLDNTYTGYKSVRSSFIPYVTIDNKKYWLLGSFHDYPRDILMDFGGSCVIWDPPREHAQGKHQQQHYQHQFGCAMLELNEESKGLLVQPVLRSLGTVKPVVYRGTDHRNKEYVWFVMVPLPYEVIKNIPAEFETAPYVLKTEKLGPLGFYQESKLLNNNYRSARNLTDFINYLSK